MSMRRDFAPLTEDIRHLDGSGLQWEAVKDNGNWIIVHGFPVPDGFNHKAASAAVRIESGYPDAQLDMVYFKPHLSRANGLPIKATDAIQSICGAPWQRWSRHRTSENPWHPGIDCLATHLLLVEHWLQREVTR